MSTSLRQPSRGQGGQRSAIGTGGWCPPTDRACVGSADASPAQPGGGPGPPATGSAHRADPQPGRVASGRTWKQSRRPGGRTRRGGGRPQPASRLTGVGVASAENTWRVAKVAGTSEPLSTRSRPQLGPWSWNCRPRLGRPLSRAVRGSSQTLPCRHFLSPRLRRPAGGLASPDLPAEALPRLAANRPPPFGQGHCVPPRGKCWRRSR